MNEIRGMVQQSLNSMLGREDDQMDAIQMGNTLMQTKTAYTTAVQVQQKRSLLRVQQSCVEEAKLSGDTYSYSWQQGGNVTEGVTIHGALCIARNFGNCVVDSQVQETTGAYIFNASFIDLETGFTITRAFRQNKVSPKTKDGKDIYRGERGQDIQFQIGQSKAIRNVVLNAVPKWIVDAVFKESKNNFTDKIKKAVCNAEGKEDQTKKDTFVTKLIERAKTIGVSRELLENIYGFTKAWDLTKLVLIASGIKTVEDGLETADNVFKARTVESTTPETNDSQKPQEEAKSENKPEAETKKKGKKAEPKEKTPEAKELKNSQQTEQELMPILVNEIQELQSAEELEQYLRVNETRLSDDTLSVFDKQDINKLIETKKQGFGK